MALRPSLGAAPTLTSTALPDSPSAPAPPQAPPLTNLAESIGRLTERLDRRADAAAVEEQTTAGQLAGDAQPGVMMEGGGDLARAAFNRGAIESAGRRIEIDARENFARLVRENPADPDGYRTAAAAYVEGVTGNLPAPLRAAVRPRLDAIAAPAIADLEQLRNLAGAQDRLATFQAALPGRLAALERAAMRLATSPGAAADVERERGAILSDLVAQGPRAAFTFQGVTYPADPTRAGAMTTPQMMRLLTEAQDTEHVGVVRGQFQAGPRTEAWIAEFERQAEAGDIPGIRPEQARRLADSFRQDLRQERAVRREGEIAARTELNPIITANRVAIEAEGIIPNPVTDDRLRAAGIDVARHRAEERAGIAAYGARQELNGIDSPERATEIAERFRPGTALFAADPQTAAQVLALARERGARISAVRLEETLRDRSAEAEAGAAQAERHVRAVPQAWRPVIDQAAAADPRIPAYLLAALIGRESGGRADAVSPAGARGPAQIMPASAASPGYGITPLTPEQVTDPAAAIPFARQYLSAMLTAYGGDMRLALMAYNWGPGNVDRWRANGSDPARVPRETQQYVAALLPAAGGDPTAHGGGGILTAIPGSGASVSGGAAPGAEGRYLTREEGRAAGMRPEEVARVNEQIAQRVRTTALTERARTGTPEEIAQVREQLAVAGPMAAENAETMRAVATALEQRARGIAEDAAAYAVANSPVLRGLQGRVVAGDTGALRALIEEGDAEQARLGIAPAQRRMLPRPVQEAIGASVLEAATPEASFERMQALGASIGNDRTVRILREARLAGGGNRDDRQDALLVAVARMGTAPDLARQMVRGAFVLRDSPPARMPANDIARDADSELGSAFAASPGARDAAIAAARAVYAAEMAASGQLGAAYDSSRFRAALTRVAPTTTYNGHRVPLPEGMTPPAFRRLLDNLPPTAMEGAQGVDGRRFTPAMLQDGSAQLVAQADGQFAILYSGMQVLRGRDQAGRPQPFILDVRNLAPVEAPIARPVGRAGEAEIAARQRRAIPQADFNAPDPPEPLGPPAPPAPARPVGERLGLRPDGRITNQPIGDRLLGRNARRNPDGSGE